MERKFGEAKQGHGLGHCRYVGKTRFTVQAYFTAIMLNLKRMVKLLTDEVSRHRHPQFYNPGCIVDIIQEGEFKTIISTDFELTKFMTRSFCPVFCVLSGFY
ncbi:transposase [candidate division KSB1 bacterium]|nr:transposase [candidate division KSB1 bacterium]